MASLPAFPPANGNVTGMPRQHKPDAESNIPNSSIRMKRANGEALFEDNPIRYNNALLMSANAGAISSLGP